MPVAVTYSHARGQIEAADRAIDALVYELYGLTGAEIGVVEGERR